MHVIDQNHFVQLTETTLKFRLESEWQALKSPVIEAAREHLGELRRIRSDWISGPTLDRMQRARVEGSAGHSNLRRQVTRVIQRHLNVQW